MQIFTWDEVLDADKKKISLIDKSAVTIGGFDGQHRGHKELCSRVLDYAHEKNLKSGVITFEHSPRSLKEKENYAGDIATLRLRQKIFEKWGFDFVVVIDFSQEFSKMNGGIFLQILLNSLNMQFLTVGEGFRCGYKGQTDTAHIEQFSKENNIDFLITPIISNSLQKISSSTIRKYVSNGNFEKCKNLLGYNYQLDVKNLPFETNYEDSELIYTIKHQAIRQILPPIGKYCVEITQENKCFQSILLLDQINLRLNVPKEYENKQFDVITFISCQTEDYSNLMGKNK